jgi:hypothetical protein
MMTDPLKHPFKAAWNPEQSEAATERALGRLPYSLQIFRGGEWVTMAKTSQPDTLMGIAAVLDTYPRRVINRNTVAASWAAGEKVGEQ